MVLQAVALLTLTLTAPTPTRVPFTYVLDYGGQHLGNRDFVPTVAGAPPQLLHLGKDVPMAHNWGPIQALGGENQAWGKGDSIRRLTPDEVAERIAGLRQMASALHGAGVRWITPYICLMTVAGDEHTRAGLWELYDHWDDYARFDLGPRPAADPIDWMQRKPDGSLQRYYAYTGDFYPPYEPNQRDAACVNNPGWGAWHHAVVRLVARCGYDGAFVDNSGSQRCYCNYCQEGFRAWMAERYQPQQFRDLFGVGAAAELKLSEDLKGLLGVETQRFWQNSIRRFQAQTRAVGSKELGRDFLLFPNGGRTISIKTGLRDCDWVMWELSLGDWGTHAGRASRTVVEDVSLAHYNRHLFEFLYPQAVGARVRGIVLSRAGYPRRIPAFEMNAAAAELGMAEAGAFSGGGAYLLRPEYTLLGDALNQYSRFFDGHPELYRDLLPAGRVALVSLADETWFGNRLHEAVVRDAVEVLGNTGVPFMLVEADDLTTAGLAGYDAVVVSEVTHLSAAARQTLIDFAAGGRPVILVGHPPTHDELDRELPADARLTAAMTVVATADGLPAALPVAGLRLLQAPDEAAEAVRLMVYRDPAGGRWVVHLVNYHVQLGDGVDQVHEWDGLKLSLPAQWKATQAVVYSPDQAESRRLAVGADGSVELPRLRICQVVEVSAR